MTSCPAWLLPPMNLALPAPPEPQVLITLFDQGGCRLSLCFGSCTLFSVCWTLKLPGLPQVCGLLESCEVCDMPASLCLYLCLQPAQKLKLWTLSSEDRCLPHVLCSSSLCCASCRWAICQRMLLPEPAGLAWQATWPAAAGAPVWQAAATMPAAPAATVPAVPTATLPRSADIRDLCVAGLPQNAS